VLGGERGMASDRGGDDLHVVPGDRSAPTEIEVLAEGVCASVEATELVEDAAAHQHAGGRHEQHATVAVTLTLVELAGVDAVVDATGQVDGRTDRLQALRIVGPAQLRPDDGDPLVGLEQRRRAARRRRVRARGRRGRSARGRRVAGRCGRAGRPERIERVEREVERGRDAEVAVGEQDTVGAEEVDEQRSGAVLARVVDREDLDPALGLGREGGQRRSQRRGTVVGDEHGDDARTGGRHDAGALRSGAAERQRFDLDATRT
jgi:hypothetical protein